MMLFASTNGQRRMSASSVVGQRRRHWLYHSQEWESRTWQMPMEVRVSELIAEGDRWSKLALGKRHGHPLEGDES